MIHLNIIAPILFKMGLRILEFRMGENAHPPKTMGKGIAGGSL
jgi:hypothetical protein